MSSQNSLLEAVVIGSGFGGCHHLLSTRAKWKDRVLLLERGRRYPMGSFPRSPHQMAANFWNLPDEKESARNTSAKRTLRGMFDIRNYTRMDAVVCAGRRRLADLRQCFSGTARSGFERGWPKGLNKTVLQPYYRVAKSVLGARPIPAWDDDPRRRIIRTELFRDFAESQQRESKLADICVFFGNDFAKPTPIGIQERNRYGAVQTSCVYCGECDVGCNTHSKNTLDLNYLYVAEHVHNAQIQTDCLAEKIVPLNERGEEDTGADGIHGYRVYYRHLDDGPPMSTPAAWWCPPAPWAQTSCCCAAATSTAPCRVSAGVSQRFSGNGDFLSFVVEGKKPADPITGR